MHDAIFYNQSGENNGAFARERLDRIAETVSELDMDQWGQCMDDDIYEDQVEEDTRTAGQSGVQGTPSFTINGQLVFGPSYEELSQQIQAAVGGN